MPAVLLRERVARRFYMNTLRTGLWTMLVFSMILVFALGCSGGGSEAPVLPEAGYNAPSNNQSAEPGPMATSGNRDVLYRGFLQVDTENMTVEVVPDRTSQLHWDVTWVKDICPHCVTASLKGWDLELRIFWIELHTQNPSNKIGRDVRFIVDLDTDLNDFDMLDPDDYTKLHDPDGTVNPFQALAETQPDRMFLPAANHTCQFQLWIAETHTPLFDIPFIIDASWPNRCQEPYMITDVEVDGEFPPGGGGSVTVDCVVWDSQMDWGEVYLRTAGIFTTDDVLMTPGADIDPDGKAFTATFSNDLGGGVGLNQILIEAYTSDTGVEPYPLNEYAPIFSDPGGESAIAGEVFNAVTKSPVNSSVVTITNTGGGPNPLPYTVTDGTYYVTVLAGNYNVSSNHSAYFLQDTLYDVIVPPETTVYVCFGLAPKYLDDPDEALASISGHIRDDNDGEPIPGAQATLDGGSTTGGVIQARITDEHGHYCFYAVPTYQQDNWTVHAFHPEYIPEDLDDVPSEQNKSTPQVDFDLTPLTADALWRENFESGPSNVGTQKDWYYDSVISDSWSGDGTTTYHGQHRASDVLWRVWDPISDPAQCIFYTNGISQLPPDDTSEGWIPDPYEGHRYMWYGEEYDDTGGSPHSGSFIDEWDGNNGGGGTSSNGYNAGWAKSGPIDLTGHDELTLSLQSYWEVEAVDPSIQYDAMDILISTDDVHWDRLDRLNPLAEPVPDSGNWSKAYTSAGFDQAAVWSPSVIDISSYGGNAEVWIRLDFDTRDPLYNGFRGWIVDDMVIWPYAID